MRIKIDDENHLVVETENGEAILKRSCDGWEISFKSEKDDEKEDSWWIPDISILLLRRGDVTKYIVYLVKHKEVIEKLDNWRKEWGEEFSSHKKFISKKILDGIDNGNLEECLEEIEKTIGKRIREKEMRKYLREETEELVGYWRKLEICGNGFRTLLIIYSPYELTDTRVFAIVFDEKNNRTEIKVTKSFGTIGDLVRNKNISKIGRMRDLSKEDLEMLERHGMITFIRGLLSEWGMEYVEKFNKYLLTLRL
ncbi:hypothetical protein J7L49_03995 [Candidatus Bathyarchaeota archaeon]|nr:hypothetical protein [Candidatus Bathyarchaeota archaeon]